MTLNCFVLHYKYDFYQLNNESLFGGTSRLAKYRRNGLNLIKSAVSGNCEELKSEKNRIIIPFWVLNVCSLFMLHKNRSRRMQ